jgi:hypothetical protein
MTPLKQQHCPDTFGRVFGTVRGGVGRVSGRRAVFCVGLLCSSCLTVLINLEVCVCGPNYCVPRERLELVSVLSARTRAVYSLCLCQAGRSSCFLHLSLCSLRVIYCAHNCDIECPSPVGWHCCFWFEMLRVYISARMEYPKGFRGFSQSVTQVPLYTADYVTTISFHIIFVSIFTNYPVI